MLKEYFPIFNYITLKDVKESLNDSNYENLIKKINSNTSFVNYHILKNDMNDLVDYIFNYILSQKIQINKFLKKKNFKFNFAKEINRVNNNIIIFFDDIKFKKFLNKEYIDFKKKYNYIDKIGYIKEDISNLNKFDYLDKNSFKSFSFILINLLENLLNDFIINIIAYILLEIYFYIRDNNIKIKTEEILNIFVKNSKKEDFKNGLNYKNLKIIKNIFLSLIRFKSTLFDHKEKEMNNFFLEIYDLLNIEGIYLLLLLKIVILKKKIN